MQCKLIRKRIPQLPTNIISPANKPSYFSSKSEVRTNKIAKQWTTIANNGQQWTTIDNNGQQWITMDNNGQQLITMDNNDFIDTLVKSL